MCQGSLIANWREQSTFEGDIPRETEGQFEQRLRLEKVVELYLNMAF
mgnify:FL=1